MPLQVAADLGPRPRETWLKKWKTPSETPTTEAVRNVKSPTTSARSTGGLAHGFRIRLPADNKREMGFGMGIGIRSNLKLSACHPGLCLDAFPDPPPRRPLPSSPDWTGWSKAACHTSSIVCHSSPSALWLCDWRHVASADDLDGGSRDGGVA
jgi:hypothetical protein